MMAVNLGKLGFKDFLRRFWFIYPLGLLRLFVGLRDGSVSSSDLPIILSIALVGNWLVFFVWRAWKNKSAGSGAASLPKSRPAYKADLDRLLSAGLPFAKQMLAERDGFIPFGASLKVAGKGSENASGQVEMEAGLVPPPGDSKEVFRLLQQAFQAHAREGKLYASAIFSNVTAARADGRIGDAIEAYLEHRDGEGMRVYLPFDKGSNGEYRFGEIYGTAAPKQVFGS